MVRLSKLREWWQNDEFIKDAVELIADTLSKQGDKDTPELITWIANSYSEDEQGIIAVYLFGQLGVAGFKLIDEGEEQSTEEGSEPIRKEGEDETGEKREDNQAEGNNQEGD